MQPSYLSLEATRKVRSHRLHGDASTGLLLRERARDAARRLDGNRAARASLHARVATALRARYAG
jgi:hypothetical protein